MTAEVKPVPYRPPAEDERDGLPQWLLSTDHKRIGLLTIGTALFLFFFNGAIALTMRAQLAQPGQDILSPQSYLQFMTMHGTGMITLTITPLAVGLGMYLVPLAVRGRAILLIWGFLTPEGASAGWWGYTPMSTSTYTPGPGMSLWTAGVFLAAAGLLLLGGTTLWTILRLRAPGVTMMRMPVFTTATSSWGTSTTRCSRAACSGSSPAFTCGSPRPPGSCCASGWASCTSC